MDHAFNLATIYVANAIGFLLIVILFLESSWRLRHKNAENWSLIGIMIAGLINCAFDPVAYTVDGLPGALPRALVYISNTLLYVSSLMAAYCWVCFMAAHMEGHIKGEHVRWMTMATGVAMLLLASNLLLPLIFNVNKNNVYNRENGYWFFLFLNYLIIIDGVILYLKSRRKNGFLKNFPIWAYLVPTMVAAVTQSLCYGISVIPAAIAISIAGIIGGLQNEQIFKDNLTGANNRTYMDHIFRQLAKTPREITGIMIDLNHFKQINERFGHSMGDKALVTATKMISESVGDQGAVIRYAGDEFIVLLSTQQDSIIKTCINEIKNHFIDHNESQIHPYTLTPSIGYSKLDLSKQTIDEFISNLDRSVYESRHDYYSRI